MKIIRFAILLTLVASAARASPAYPGVVVAEWSVPSTLPAPPCTLCHATRSGGVNTTTQLFGRTVQKLGARGNDPGSLQAALDEDESQGTDSDGDHVSDFDEVREGRSPNVPQPFILDGGTVEHFAPPAEPPTLKTGCTIGHARPSGVEGERLLALSLLVLLFRRRARRRAEPNPAAQSPRL